MTEFQIPNRKDDLRYWLGRLVVARHEAELAVLEEYDSLTNTPRLQQASSSTPSATTKADSTSSKVTPATVSTTDNSFDLTDKVGLVLATVSRRGTSYVVTPKVAMSEKVGIYANFLAGGSKQILPNIARMHSEFRFWPVFENGILVRLEMSGVDDSLWTKDLRSPLIWALEHAEKGK